MIFLVNYDIISVIEIEYMFKEGVIMDREGILKRITRELDQDIEKYIEKYHLTHSEVLYILAELSAIYEESMFKVRNTLIKEIMKQA
ncbi:hypothetical protein [Sporohalobacter salinus]|uniref:hypothetical protein n=1 Tax=Sporohalobacter salinus TaxID=1494606 RepID=UPI0019606962|nr:hypothetical protein [Sporohalobacter salinus]MBM7624136.1 hypothetical protein [Sporohalobacter salinus]